MLNDAAATSVATTTMLHSNKGPHVRPTNLSACESVLYTCARRFPVCTFAQTCSELFGCYPITPLACRRTSPRWAPKLPRSPRA